MKKEEMIQKAYEIAVERYAAVGVDTEKVLKTMQDFHLSLHCWQADDVTGFEVQAGALSGGIQATGNYPGKARNIDELRADILKAASYITGCAITDVEVIGTYCIAFQTDTEYF